MKIRIIRKTDQWNNEDFESGSRVFTISHVTEGREQAPYDIHFSDGDGKCWRPSNGMLELLVNLWGNEAKDWAGRQVELFRDPTVTIGREVVGGIRVRSMSHIEKAMSSKITVSRGTKKPYAVKPLAVAPVTPQQPSITPFLDAIGTAATMDALKAAWIAIDTAGLGKNPKLYAAKEAKKKELE